MNRDYTTLDCGCLISCDGGGGLIPACSGLLERSPNCKVDEYMKKHNIWCGGYCKICHPYEFNEAKKKGEKVYKEK